MPQTDKCLYLIWKDPNSHRNFTVGKLCKDNKFSFEYFGEHNEAEAYGWTKLESFPEEKLYESDIMFPVFTSRLPDRKRRDIDKILKRYGLSEFDEFELLRKSEARLPIDTYSFISPISPTDETIQKDFFIMGVQFHANCKGNNCAHLTKVDIGEELIFKVEKNNPYDSNAICILTQKKEILGYVPRYYNTAILKRLEKSMTYSCKVIDVNFNQNCSECIKVRLNMPRKI